MPSALFAPVRLTAARLAFAFTIAFALFSLVPVALSDEDAFKGLTWGDLVDFPIVLLPIALLLGMALDARINRTSGLFAVALLFLLLFAQGHAIHLAANAIAHNFTRTDAAWRTAHFLDERVGHYELHIALIALAALFIWSGRHSSLQRYPEVPLLLLSILGFGALQAAAAIEGQTVPLVLPGTLALAVVGISLSTPRSNDYAVFFTGTSAVSFLVLVIYGAVYGGWPEIL